MKIITYLRKSIQLSISMFLAFQFTNIFLAEDTSKIKYELILALISIALGFCYNFVTVIVFPNKKIVKHIDKLTMTVKYGDIFNMRKKKKRGKGQLILVPVHSGFDGSENSDLRIAESTPQAHITKIINSSSEKPELKFYNGYCIYDRKYLLFEMGKLNQDGQLIYENVSDYFMKIQELCKIIDIEDKNFTIICPVIGGRIKFRTSNISNKQRLKIMMSAFETFNFRRYTDLQIILLKHNEKNKRYDIRTF